MSLRVIMIALLLLVAGALGVIGYQISGGPRAAAVAKVETTPTPVPTGSYLVAARPLSPGTLMRSEDFTARTVPLDQMPTEAIVDLPNARIEYGAPWSGISSRPERRCGPPM